MRRAHANYSNKYSNGNLIFIVSYRFSLVYSFACIDTFRPQTPTANAMWRTNETQLMSTPMSLAGVSRPNNTLSPPHIQQKQMDNVNVVEIPRKNKKKILSIIYECVDLLVLSFVAVLFHFGPHKNCVNAMTISNIDSIRHPDLLDTRREGKIRFCYRTIDSKLTLKYACMQRASVESTEGVFGGDWCVCRGYDTCILYIDRKLRIFMHGNSMKSSQHCLSIKQPTVVALRRY